MRHALLRATASEGALAASLNAAEWLRSYEAPAVDIDAIAAALDAMPLDAPLVTAA